MFNVNCDFAAFIAIPPDAQMRHYLPIGFRKLKQAKGTKGYEQRTTARSGGFLDRGFLPAS
jgi:hypothetical protein